MNDHYRKTYYSETEAAAIVKKNEDMMTEKGREVSRARRGLSDVMEARKLGISVEEYRELMG